MIAQHWTTPRRLGRHYRLLPPVQAHYMTGGNGEFRASSRPVRLPYEEHIRLAYFVDLLKSDGLRWRRLVKRLQGTSVG